MLQIAEPIELLLEDLRRVRNFTLTSLRRVRHHTSSQRPLAAARQRLLLLQLSCVHLSLRAPQPSCTLVLVDYCQSLPVPFPMNLKAKY